MAAVGGDRDRVLDAFDDLAAVVFASICRMLGGSDPPPDPRDVLVETFAGLRADEVEVDGRYDVRLVITHAAQRVAEAIAPRGGEVAQPRASVEGVVAELALVHHRPLAEIAGITGLPPPDVDALVERAQAFQALDPHGRARNEVWFDDTMRAEARERLTARITGSDPSSSARRHRIDVIGALAFLVVAALIVGWLANGDDPSAAPPPSFLDNGGRGTSGTDAGTALGPDDSGPSGSTPDDSAPDSTPDGSGPDDAAPDDPAPGGSAPVDEGVTTTTEPAPLRYVLDPPPPGYRVTSAQEIGAVPLRSGPRAVLWASPDASRTSGRWFVASPEGASSELRFSADPLGASPPTVRVDLGGRPALQLLAPDGVVQTQVRVDDQWMLTFQSFGVTNEDLASLASQAIIRFDDPVEFGAGANAALSGLRFRATGAYRGGFVINAFGSPEFAVTYADAAAENGVFLRVGPQAPDDLFAASLLASTRDGSSTATTVGTSPAVIGDVAFDFGSRPVLRFVMFHRGGRTVLIETTDTVDVLLAAAQAVRVASDEEWEAAQHAEPPTVTLDGTVPAVPTAEPRAFPIGTTIDRNGTTWSVTLTTPSPQQMTGAAPGADATIDVHEATAAPPESSFQPSQDHSFAISTAASPLIKLESIDATVLVVLVPAASTTATTMRAVIGGVRTVELPLEPLATPTPSLASSYAFSEVGPLTVELIDAAGSVVQRLTP